MRQGRAWGLAAVAAVTLVPAISSCGAGGDSAATAPAAAQGRQDGPGSTSAQFTSTRSQPAGRAGTTTPITYTSGHSHTAAIRLVGTRPASALLVTQAGKYNLQFVAQVLGATPGMGTIRIWPEAAGYAGGACGGWAGIPRSASHQHVRRGELSSMTVNVIVRVDHPTCVRIAMQSASTTNPAAMLLRAAPQRGPIPGAPSVSTSIWRIA